MTQDLIDLLTALLLLAGAGFALIGSIAIVRLPDIFTRLHGPTKATTLGVGGVLISSILFFSSRGGLSVHELLVTIFLVITAPVSAYLIARVALHRVTVQPPRAVSTCSGIESCQATAGGRRGTLLP
jgi:multicomponent K+:H+ antiporter subunit G